MAFSDDSIKDSGRFEKKINVGFEKNQLHIKGLTKISSATIYDFSGKMIERLELKNGSNQVINPLIKGHYILQMENESVRFMAK